MKKSVQLYSIRNLASENLEEALKTISEIGYEGVELACVSIDRDVNELKSWLQKYKLAVSGSHVNVEDLFNRPDDSIAFYKAIGCERIIIPGAPLKTKEDIKELAKKCRAILPKLKENNMRLYYHNHSHEFEKDGEEYLIDILANEMTKDELFLEFDIFWVTTGKECPVKYLNKYKDRIDVFHAKDGIDGKGTALGEGAVDTKASFKTAREIGCEWAVVESEASEDKLEQVESIRNDYNALLELLKN